MMESGLSAGLLTHTSLHAQNAELRATAAATAAAQPPPEGVVYRDRHGRRVADVEAVVARVCEGDLDVRPAVAEAPVLPEPLAEGARVVVLRGKGDAKSLGDGDASGEGQGSEAMKDAILARLARMEEEEERERIRRYEAQRLRRGAGAADVYADDYDDSFDDFVRYDFQDGEELGDGDDDSDDGGEGAAVPAAAAAAPVVVPQQQSQQQQGGRGGGRGGGRRGGRGKNHHQSDRAMSKRNRGMVPIARP